MLSRMSSRRPKQRANRFTITIDLKVLSDIPSEGISLLQTRLCHVKRSKGGRVRVSETDGECRVSSAGGIGLFGSYGDTTKRRIQKGKWTRVALSVRCVGDGTDDAKPGRMSTYIDGHKCATIKRKELSTNGRFCLDSGKMYFFSSQKASMMGVSLAVRTIRIDHAFLSSKEIMARRAQDRILSMHNERRQLAIAEQQRGLSLMRLFPRPRPMWNMPATVFLFGDAFLDGKMSHFRDAVFAGLIEHPFVVINHCLQRMLDSQADLLQGFSSREMSLVSDVALIFRKSRHLFKYMRKLMRKPSDTALIVFLKKLRTQLRETAVGESHVLPLWVDREEMLVLFTRTAERTCRLVVINTNPECGLKFHAVRYNAQTQPKVKYRTCLVLDDIPAKNALDDVFWMALYQLVLAQKRTRDLFGRTEEKFEDTRKMYEVLLPFVTGKPLESSLVEAEQAATAGKLGSFGFWRSPQRSATASVRCTMNVLDFCLRSRGLPKLKSKQVRVALRAQVVAMIRNDLDFVFPDSNGEKVCRIACQQLSYCAVKLEEASASNAGADQRPARPRAESKVSAETTANETKTSEPAALKDDDADGFVSVMLKRVTALVDDVTKMLSACRKDQADLPHILKLESTAASQFADALAWESPPNEPNPGQAVSLNRYVPVDFLQLPTRATSRKEAVRALWLTDRLAALIEQQGHCVKNGGLLVFSMIQNLFTQVLPLPKPRGRGAGRSGSDLHVSGHASRRKKRKLAKGKTGNNWVAPPNSAEAKNAPAAAAEVTPATADPDGTHGQRILHQAVHEKCIWDQDIKFQTQLQIMETLERIMHHFVAASNSICESREHDTIRVIVGGCMAVIADAVMRRRATDHPSEICSHLMGQLRDGKQLGIPGFGLSYSSFDTQTETLEVHVPELCVARTAVLDYFSSPQQRMLSKIFTWEDHHQVRLSKNTAKYLRNICRELAMDTANPSQLLVNQGTKMRLQYFYPELTAYQTITFYFKWFLNPDLGEHRNRMSTTPDNCQLRWSWNTALMHYDVRVGRDQAPVRCKPMPKSDSRGDPLPAPTHRYPSTATPGFYLPKPVVRTEDDVIYRPHLPGFAEPGGSDILGQRDSELLLSYLTVPYLRLPLVLTFFSTEDRVHKLESIKLRDILDSVLFEPGRHLQLQLLGQPPVEVPTHQPELLAAPFGMLLNELVASPDTVVESVLRMLKAAVALDTGAVEKEISKEEMSKLKSQWTKHYDANSRAFWHHSVTNKTQWNDPAIELKQTRFNTSVGIILYVIRLSCRIDNFLSFLIQYHTNTHNCINKRDVKLRGIDITPAQLELLQTSRHRLRLQLFGPHLSLIDDYLRKLDRQIAEAAAAASSDNVKVSGRVALACNLHAHKLLMFRNVLPGDPEFGEEGMLEHDALHYSAVVKSISGSFVFLTTRHTWNQAFSGVQLPKFGSYYTPAMPIGGQQKNNQHPPLLIPEPELYELLTVQRRRLIDYCLSMSQGPLDLVLQTSLQVSTSSAGVLQRRVVVDSQNRWSRIAGHRSRGRFAVASTRSGVSPATGASAATKDGAGLPPPPRLQRQTSWDREVGEVSESAFVGVEMDLQIGQMTLRSKHLAALNTAIANNADVMDIFSGKGTIQASQLEDAEFRKRYRLVGLNHELDHWPTPHKACQPLSGCWERTYDPSELFPTEQWMASLFEPVRKSFFAGPKPPAMSFLLPEHPLHAEAEVAVLVGEHQYLGGSYKLVYVFRRLRCVHVYECVTHGHQWWWTLHLTTDARYTLRDMQPSTDDRRMPPPYWWARGSGKPYPQGPAYNLYNDLEKGSITSVVIRRDATHPENWSGGQETLVPKRLLCGVIPDCLHDKYRFWQDASLFNWKSSLPREAQAVHHKRLRGYPRDSESGEYVLIVEFSMLGDWDAFAAPKAASKVQTSVLGDACRAPTDAMFCARQTGRSTTTYNPGRTVRVYRVPRTAAEDEFKQHQKVAAELESLSLLTARPVRSGARSSSNKNKDKGDGDANEGRTEFRKGDPCFYFSDGRWLNATVVSVNEGDEDDPAGTVKYSVSVKEGQAQQNNYGRSAGETFDNIDPVLLKRSKGRFRIGHGAYYWEGMTDSEEEDWDPVSDDEDDEGTKRASNSSDKKKRLHFEHFEQIPLLLAVTDNDLDALLDALRYFKVSQFGSGEKFGDVPRLVAALKASQRRRLAKAGLLLPSDTDADATKDLAAHWRKGSAIDPSRVHVLLDLLYAPRASRLHSIAVTLARIERLAYICAWGRLSKPRDGKPTEGGAKDGEGGSEDDSALEAHAREPSTPGFSMHDVALYGCVHVDSIELPRLKLNFCLKNGRLYSVDHADLFISNDR